jgi:hypothetical protein
MKTIQRVGPYVEVVEARAPDNPVLVVKLGLRDDSSSQVLHHNLRTTVAQYYGIVQDGLLNARHAFKGLKRPLMHGEDMEADKSVIIYSWRAEFDYVWTGSRFDGKPVRKSPPANRVFVVLVREEQQPNDYGVFGSIEHWNWIKEDPELLDAPLEWPERYGQKLWSRNI